MAEKNSDMEKMWALMEKSNAGVMKVVLDTNGVPASRMMIFVDGVTEVAAIKAVVTDWLQVYGEYLGVSRVE